MELIAKILQFVESEGTPGRTLSRPSIKGYDQEVVNYHVHLCGEAGFIRFKPAMQGLVHHDQIVALTWAGHEFLDSLGAGKP